MAVDRLHWAVDVLRLTHHPHVHMIVPGGGISPDGERWVAAAPISAAMDQGRWKARSQRVQTSWHVSAGGQIQEIEKHIEQKGSIEDCSVLKSDPSSHPARAHPGQVFSPEFRGRPARPARGGPVAYA